jgi:outer membrane receptor for monomeric catechols
MIRVSFICRRRLEGVENNLPDYGIPFIDGAPAHVERSNFYGLVNYDRTRTNTNIGTLGARR